jgi:hypothetical protein
LLITRKNDVNDQNAIEILIFGIFLLFSMNFSFGEMPEVGKQTRVDSF